MDHSFIQVGAQVDKAFDKLLADPRVALRALPASVPLHSFRAAADAFMAKAACPGMVHTRDMHVVSRHGGIPVRIYSAEKERQGPTIVFVHGGGFVLGGLDSHDAICRNLAQGSGAVVVAVDYALAPEHPFPRPLEDVLDVIEWVRNTSASLPLNLQSIALAGDSAGGQLALAAALNELRAGRPVHHVGVLYPMIDPSRTSRSARVYADGYMLTGDFISYGWSAYQGSDPATPFNAQFDLRLADLTGFPPTTIVIAECDPLHDDAVMLAGMMRSSGASVETKTFLGMIHGFAGLPQVTTTAVEALDYLASQLARGLKSETGNHNFGEAI